jgi:hypothetical protein
MFYSFQRLIDDVNIVRFGVSKQNDFPSAGSIDKSVNQARSRVIVKLIMTFLVIGACAFLANRSGARETDIRIAHVGFGIVIGYWFR